jgi:hypothetical protein
MTKKAKKTERSKVAAGDHEEVYDDTDEEDEEWVAESPDDEVKTLDEVVPLAAVPVPTVDKDVQMTNMYNSQFADPDVVTAPSAALARTLTVTVANPTPPTNVPVEWQGTPPTPWNKDENAVTTPAQDEASKGVFKTPDDAEAAAGRAEASGTEVHVNSTDTRTTTHSVLGNYTEFPNQTHPSTRSPATNPTLTSLGTTSTASGTGTVSQTVTGTGFNPQSKIVVNGVTQTTTFTSATSLTAPAVTKKATAGTWPVVVATGGAVVTAPQTWTFT